MHAHQASYLYLFDTGELAERAAAARQHLNACNLCGHGCQSNRLAGELGTCGTADEAIVYAAHAHFGEEMPLVGWRGSGTVFFSHCNLQCLFCQNWELSHRGEGQCVDAERLARMMLSLQDEGCHNLNLVSPTHVLPKLLEALIIAADHGLRLPLVYNTGGYDSLEALALLDGVVDIYMPDMKFADSERCALTCGAEDYPEVNRRAVKEMHRQVGDLIIDDHGLAHRGLLVRHLLMPDGLRDAEAVAAFLAEEISPRTVLNLMSQYRPPTCGIDKPELNRCITDSEYQLALQAVDSSGLYRIIADENPNLAS